MIHQIIYSSAANADLTKADIIEIAREAQHKNSQIGVTGMMVCHQGSILQVLEGEKTVVEALYMKISADNRHTQILRLIGQQTEAREFSDWAMGFKYIPNDVSDPDLQPLLAKTYKEILPENASVVVKAISRSFARVNGLDSFCG